MMALCVCWPIDGAGQLHDRCVVQNDYQGLEREVWVPSSQNSMSLSVSRAPFLSNWPFWARMSSRVMDLSEKI